MYNDVLEFEWPDDGLNPDDQANSAENNSSPLAVTNYMDQFNRTMTNTLRDLLSTVTSNPGIAKENGDSIAPETPVENGETIFTTLNNTMSTKVSNGLSNFTTETAGTGSLFESVTKANTLENAVTDELSTTDIIRNFTNNILETLFSTDALNNTHITSPLDILTTESSQEKTNTFKNVLNNVTQSIHDIILTSTENNLNQSTDSNQTVITTDHILNSTATTLVDSAGNFTVDDSTIFASTTEPTTYISNSSNGTFLTNGVVNLTTEATTLMANVSDTIVETTTNDTSTITNILSTTGNVHSTTNITTTDISTVIDNFTHRIFDKTEASILSKPNNSTFLSTNRPDVTTILTKITTATNKPGASYNYNTIETAQDIMMYIIIGVVLVFLIIIFIGLYLYYRKQRKGSLHIGSYYVTELHDTSSSNKSNNSIPEKKEDSGV